MRGDGGIAMRRQLNMLWLGSESQKLSLPVLANEIAGIPIAWLWYLLIVLAVLLLTANTVNAQRQVDSKQKLFRSFGAVQQESPELTVQASAAFETAAFSPD